MSSVKILVCGSVNGQFQRLFGRVETVNKKSGPFEFLLCCGAFFGADGTDGAEWREYVSGRRTVPLQTYVLGSGGGAGGELCSGVVALGERGLFTTSAGISVLYLASSEPDVAAVRALEQAASAARPGGVDVLLTPGWPLGLTRYASGPAGVYSEETGSRLLARLLFTTRPRYVFSGGSEIHYERLPYRNHQVLHGKQTHVTRFISLAAAFNAQKHKYLYAFSLAPLASVPQAELTAQPVDVTECPFNQTEMEAALSEPGSKESVTQYFYSTDQTDAGQPARKKRRRDAPHSQEGRERSQREEGGARPPARPCWFCLSSPEVEKHLVVHVGDTCYLALAKGGLVEDHLLVLPVEHVRAASEADEPVWQELARYKRCLRRMFADDDRAVVFYERNYRQSHLQVQCVPVPNTLSLQLKQLVQQYCEDQQVTLDQLPPLSDLRQLVRPGTPYFYTELPSGERLLHRVRGAFPLNLGRAMLAAPDVLDMEQRAEWADCVLSKEQETEIAKRLKLTVKKYITDE